MEKIVDLTTYQNGLSVYSKNSETEYLSYEGKVYFVIHNAKRIIVKNMDVSKGAYSKFNNNLELIQKELIDSAKAVTCSSIDNGVIYQVLPLKTKYPDFDLSGISYFFDKDGKLRWQNFLFSAGPTVSQKIEFVENRMVKIKSKLGLASLLFLKKGVLRKDLIDYTIVE